MSATLDIEETSTVPSTRKSKIQPDWSHAPSKEDLYNDYASAEDGQEQWRTKLTEWDLVRDGGKEIKGVKTGKSTARPLVVRKQNEWKYPSIEEPFLNTQDMFKVKGTTGVDAQAATQNALILNNQWATKVKKVKLVGDVARTVVDEGTVIVKTGWRAEYGIHEVEVERPVYASAEESLMIMKQQMQQGAMSEEQARAMLELGEPMQIGTEIVIEEQEYLVKNHPTYEVCINSNVTIDPTCDGIIEDAMFAIHEYDTSYSELKEQEYESNEDGSSSGFYHNIDSIQLETADEHDEARSDAANNFRFKDKARKKMKAYEYWGYWDIQGDGELVSIVATWVNDTLIRLEENPFPHGRIPFSVATYMPVKKAVHGEPDAELLKENQEAIGRMTRAVHDVTAQQAVGQEFIDENFFPSPSQKNNYEKGNTVYYRSGFDPRMAIHKKDTQQLGNAPFQVIEWQTKDAAELSGTVPFQTGTGGGKLSASGQDRDAMDSTAKRELSILRRLSEMFIDMARMTIAMNQVFLSEEEVIRVTDKEFVTIKRDDLEGDFDLSVEVSTPEKDEYQATKLMTLMQTNAANTDPEIVKMHYVKMAKLWKMPDLADAVQNYQPQPDPSAIKLQELAIKEAELKNAILLKELEDYDSKIYERLSRTESNSTVEAEAQKAKTDKDVAAAGKLRAETDKIDQEYLQDQDGVSHDREIQKINAKSKGDVVKQTVANQAKLDSISAKMGVKNGS